MKAILNHVYFIWAILALPSLPMIARLLNGADAHRLLHPTGEFAARFLIVAMMLTPLAMLFPRSRFIRWLIVRRRAFGVAAFCYALAHTLFYIVDLGSLKKILDDFLILGVWTGWAAFAIMLPLAITSNAAMVKRLKTKWKPLQRMVYAAAVLTFIHWIFIHNHLGPALVHFVPLAALEAYRIVKTRYS